MFVRYNGEVYIRYYTGAAEVRAAVAHELPSSRCIVLQLECSGCCVSKWSKAAVAYLHPCAAAAVFSLWFDVDDYWRSAGLRWLISLASVRGSNSTRHAIWCLPWLARWESLQRYFSGGERWPLDFQVCTTCHRSNCAEAGAVNRDDPWRNCASGERCTLLRVLHCGLHSPLRTHHCTHLRYLKRTPVSAPLIPIRMHEHCRVESGGCHSPGRGVV